LLCGRLHGWMDEEFDHPVISPHAPLPFPNALSQHQCEIDPVRVDSLVDSRIRLNPIPVDVTRIRFLGTETPVNVDLHNTCLPERLDGGAESLQKPSPPRREAKALGYFVRGCLMIARRQSAGIRVERRNQAASIISDTIYNVNENA